MVEIRPTGQPGLLKPTWRGPVQPGPPSNGICYFYHNILLSNNPFLNKTYCFHGLYHGDSLSVWLGVAEKVSHISNYFWCIKWVILHDHMLQYGYSMRLVHRVIAFPQHAILSRMFYQHVLWACWFIPWQAALKSFYRYINSWWMLAWVPFWLSCHLL